MYGTERVTTEGGVCLLVMKGLCWALFLLLPGSALLTWSQSGVVEVPSCWGKSPEVERVTEGVEAVGAVRRRSQFALLGWGHRC